MSAVMVEHKPPSGLGHDLLEHWASYMRGGLPLGRASSLHERLDRPHDEVPQEVMLVDRIVARIGVEYPAYRRMINRYYLGREAPWQIAGILGYTEGFVWLSLRAVADLVARRYEELAGGLTS